MISLKQLLDYHPYIYYHVLFITGRESTSLNAVPFTLKTTPNCNPSTQMTNTNQSMKISNADSSMQMTDSNPSMKISNANPSRQMAGHLSQAPVSQLLLDNLLYFSFAPKRRHTKCRVIKSQVTTHAITKNARSFSTITCYFKASSCLCPCEYDGFFHLGTWRCIMWRRESLIKFGVDHYRAEEVCQRCFYIDQLSPRPRTFMLVTWAIQVLIGLTVASTDYPCHRYIKSRRYWRVLLD